PGRAPSSCSATLVGIRPRAADRDALVFRPGLDVRAVLTAECGPPGPAPLPPPRLVGVLNEGRDLPAERIGVLLLRSISYSVAPSPNRTVSSAGPPSATCGRRPHHRSTARSSAPSGWRGSWPARRLTRWQES